MAEPVQFEGSVSSFDLKKEDFFSRDNWKGLHYLGVEYFTFKIDFFLVGCKITRKDCAVLMYISLFFLSRPHNYWEGLRYLGV